jgi:hypothetical protein
MTWPRIERGTPTDFFGGSDADVMGVRHALPGLWYYSSEIAAGVEVYYIDVFNRPRESWGERIIWWLG